MHPLREWSYRNLTHRHFRRAKECSTLIRWLDPRPGERILDIGCGDGFFDHQMAMRGARVDGIDIHAARLQIAARRNTTPLTQYHAMDAEQLSFPSACFDKAISLCVIEHFHHEDRVLRQVTRVLKPGGTLFLSADSLSNPEITDAERAHQRERYAVNTYYTVEVLRQKLEQAGLVLEQTRYLMTTPFTLSLVRWSWKLDLAASRRLQWFGNAFLQSAGRLASAGAEALWGRRDSGLTLLARARKPG